MEESKYIYRGTEVQQAVLIGVQTQKQTDAQTKEYLDELAFLARTAGVEPIKIFQQNLEQPHPKFFVGTGKLAEIKSYILVHELDLVIFDDELTPSQLKFIETELEVRILDRTNLILDIFAQRAETSYARTQVELAQYEYLLPRLTRMWTHLERQKGGIGMRGPGETQIETDRRIMRDRIAKLKSNLKSIDKQMATQRGNRAQMVRVSLVGYTNVGKSTIMNLLSKSKVLAENKLFATLDTTVRKVVIDNLPFLLSDTVGFIRKLPTQLVESFKSTLDEVRESDLLVHVLDVSHPNFEEHYDVVNTTIAEITKEQKKNVFVVFNKVDALLDLENQDLENQLYFSDLQKAWRLKLGDDNCVFLSATERTNYDAFRELFYHKVKAIHEKRFPFNNFLY
tara:strand:+ start:320313 stop:321500 length:1188 start_codon:yes stop_codon:yes gene_type:complete